MSKAETNELRKYRRIRHDAEDSDCEEEKGGAKQSTNGHVKKDVPSANGTAKADEISADEIEKRISTVKKSEPDIDVMVIQEVLSRNNWNMEKSLESLRANKMKRRISESPQKVSTSKSSNGHHHNHHHHHHNHHHKHHHKDKHSSHHVSKKRKTNAENDSSDNEDSKPTQSVFDSDDDSDNDSDRMTKDRINVYEFMNNGELSELLTVKTVTLKKAETIVELRPFRNWTDLVVKFKTNKPLHTDVLNLCQEYLKSRNNLTSIMKKCNKIVETLEEAVEKGGGLLEQPSILDKNFKLADYQMIGLNWLAVMFQNDMNGILADEMGLGKTIQVIAFLAYLKERNLSKNTHLIVVPSSTMDNWEAEMAKWCPTLNVVKYYGNQEDRRAMRIHWVKNGTKDVDVILTTYFIVSASAEEKKMFRVTPMHYVIFDEAHMLKNMTTQRYTNLFRIRAERRLLLTGTPLQNNLLELMSLLCFVMPTLLGSKAEDIKNLFQKNKGPKDMGDVISSFEQNQIDKAKRIMKPFILRRLKKDVLTSLPKKTQEVVKLPMSETQAAKYNFLVENYKSATGVVGATSEVSGITIMMDMRKLANHPLLLRYYFPDERVMKMARILANDSMYKNNNPQEIFEDLAILSDFKLYQLRDKYKCLYDVKIPDEVLVDSGKFRYLDNLLPKLKNDGHRVLIFSQFTMMLDVMEKYMGIRKHKYLRLDGQTPTVERQEMINEYNSDPQLFVFLLSTKAGGLGINLTAADTVIIHDIDFNPYNDKQAEDRSHRMGQTKPVTIYKLISESTIEEGMLHVANEKLQLEKDVTTEEVEKQEEMKCMVRLLTMALGMDEKRAENLLSPTSTKNTARVTKGEEVE